MDGFSRMLAVEGSRQRRWNWMPATALLMEDGCNFLDSKQWTIKALIQDMLTGRVAMEKIAQKVVKFAF